MTTGSREAAAYLSSSGQGRVADPYDPSISIKGAKFLGRLSDC
jgi:hypothetical protein